jgi:indolepyruvate ferredoxin oxidoreductase
MLSSLFVPTLYPGNVQEVLDLGRHAIELSRACGLWSAMKMVTNVCDAAATVKVGPDRVTPALTRPDSAADRYQHRPNATMIAPHSLDMERSLFGSRLELAKAYARDNRLNYVVGAGKAWLGIVAAGKTYYDLRQALSDLGLTEDDLARHGVRILKLGMVWPLEPECVREFADGLEEILVVEEKLGFLERELKSVLYGGSNAPRIVGKSDERQNPLVPADAELDADRIADVLAARLGRRIGLDSVQRRLTEIARHRHTEAPAQIARTPFFCSGCPHNSSTPVPDGTLVGAGIGCHTMIALNPQGKGQITGITQMGGEGMQWVGMAPFTQSRHFVQNLGDGTFQHSGSLAIRASVAASVNVTYKLFYNEAVAMTGGQEVQGLLPVDKLTRLLELEGVKRTIVTTDDPGKYRRVKLARNAEVRDRSQSVAAQDELAEVAGVTVLIHDQQCAAEKRRLRRRGKLAEPKMRVVINERVCEGCGDCGEKSECLSVQPVETEYGRKTQIHQSSCNKDYSCLDGDCPSFVAVEPGKAEPQRETAVPVELSEPTRIVGSSDFTARMIGIGGTGVVTVSQILAMAAHLEGKYTDGLDQTGLSQKGGPVTSDVRISDTPIEGANKTSMGGADLYLGFDLLGATDSHNLQTAAPGRTIAVVSTSAIPTGQMVVDPEAHLPPVAESLKAIDSRSRGSRMNCYLDAQALAQAVFADHMVANLIVLGAAYQRGALPVSAQSIEQAIRINGVGIEQNLEAFGWGRACVIAPETIESVTGRQRAGSSHLTPRLENLVASAGVDGEAHRLLSIRVPDLVAYQSRRYAKRYVDFVRWVAEIEQERVPGGRAVTEAVASQLYKLMAYKDEYEVARLHLDTAEQAKLRTQFGEDAKIWFYLHPPLLRALGLKRKLKLGSWFIPVFRALKSLRFLRKTPLDPFGFAKVRRVERQLIGEYEGLVGDALSRLSQQNHSRVVALCQLPEMIRGYEQIKLDSVDRFRAEASRLSNELKTGVALPVAPQPATTGKA